MCVFLILFASLFMTPSLVSRCRRVTYRYLHPHNDAVQFPEAILTAVFERYYVIIRIAARYGSCVPGPMENRRRMGKRQMAALNFGQSHSASPLWAFENLPDLTQWKWKSPSSLDALLRRGREENIVLYAAICRVLVFVSTSLLELRSRL